MRDDSYHQDPVHPNTHTPTSDHPTTEDEGRGRGRQDTVVARVEEGPRPTPARPEGQGPDPLPGQGPQEALVVVQDGPAIARRFGVAEGSLSTFVEGSPGGYLVRGGTRRTSTQIVPVVRKRHPTDGRRTVCRPSGTLFGEVETRQGETAEHQRTTRSGKGNPNPSVQVDMGSGGWGVHGPGGESRGLERLGRVIGMVDVRRNPRRMAFRVEEGGPSTEW